MSQQTNSPNEQAGPIFAPSVFGKSCELQLILSEMMNMLADLRKQHDPRLTVEIKQHARENFDKSFAMASYMIENMETK